MPRGNQAAERLTLLHRVGNARHHHMSNNDPNLATGKLIAKRQDARRIATGQLFMLNRIGMLDVEQHHIGLVENSIELLRMLGIKCIATAV